jgi:hypothetical protein
LGSRPAARQGIFYIAPDGQISLKARYLYQRGWDGNTPLASITGRLVRPVFLYFDVITKAKKTTVQRKQGKSVTLKP